MSPVREGQQIFFPFLSVRDGRALSFLPWLFLADPHRTEGLSVRALQEASDVPAQGRVHSRISKLDLP